MRGYISEQTVRIPRAVWKHAYLAGLIDGEGSIYGRYGKKNNFLGQVKVANTYKPMMNWLTKNFGGKIIVGLHKRRIYHKPVYNWTVWRHRDALAILGVTYPYLINKKRAACITMKELRKRISTAGERPRDEARAKKSEKPKVGSKPRIARKP